MNGLKPIGVAYMDEDGTLILHLHAETDTEYIGKATFIFTKDDLEYAQYLEHLGGLSPGEMKSVPPWTD